jgi:N-acetylglutamate synthase-like GNAT family acetyltransferase
MWLLPRINGNGWRSLLSEIRKLADAEYDLLLKVEEGYRPDPAMSIAVVAEADGKIVGRMLLVAPAHIEGTWVKEEFRHGTTGIRMIRFMEAEAKKLGLAKIFSYAGSASIEDYLKRLGYTRCQLTVWEKEL